MTRIAVIGAGFSGTLLALHLLRRCPASVQISLIERHRNFGRGAAYASGNPDHLLNVPAARMSAFQDRPSDFLDWLNRQAPGAEPGSFVPRQRFGSYIRALLNEEMKQPGATGRLDLVRGCALRLETGTQETGNVTTIVLDRDRCLNADFVVLAIGNFPPEPPSVADPGFYDTPRYRGDPWSADALADIPTTAPVLLIGTGLTMVDTLIGLRAGGHTGPVHALSRRGLLPRAHVPARPAPRPAPDLPASISACLRLIRDEAKRAIAAGSTWQAVIDDLRPVTRDLWQTLDLTEKRRFLRHVRPWWDVCRHRLAPPIAAMLDDALARGDLVTHAGRILGFHPDGDQVSVEWRPRRGTTTQRLPAAAVINCAGPGADYDRIEHPLIRSLLRDGVVRPDPLRLGLDVTPSGALRNRVGAISRRLFAVGPVTKPAFWEMTAVPDIRRQCELTAALIASLV